jgi:hypothetical protein
MAAETTVATLAGWFHSQLIDKLMYPYAIDSFCSMKHVRVAPCPQGTKVVSFPTATKDTALSGTITEATGLSNVAFDTTKASATVAEVGIMRQSTKLSGHQNLYGENGLLMAWIDDGLKMCHEKCETDVNAEWTNASTSVGTSGSTFKIADLGSALAQHTINKSQGSLYGYLHATAGKNLRNEVLGSGAAWLTTGAGNNLLKRTNSDGYMGNILDIELYTNNLGLASSADKISCIMVDGQAPGQAQYSATAMAVAWDVQMTPIWYNPALSGGMQVAFTMAYGLVEAVDHAYVKAATIA